MTEETWDDEPLGTELPWSRQSPWHLDWALGNAVGHWRCPAHHWEVVNSMATGSVGQGMPRENKMFPFSKTKPHKISLPRVTAFLSLAVRWETSEQSFTQWLSQQRAACKCPALSPPVILHDVCLVTLFRKMHTALLLSIISTWFSCTVILLHIWECQTPI